MMQNKERRKMSEKTSRFCGSDLTAERGKNMTEYIFRGIREDNDEFVIGGSVITLNTGGKVEYFMPCPQEKCNCVHGEDNDNILCIIGSFNKIKTGTVSLFTNFRDRLGNMVFGGDILRWRDPGEEEYSYFLVVLAHSRWQIWRNGDLRDNDDLDDGFLQDAEVVGTIYKNADLLKKEMQGEV